MRLIDADALGIGICNFDVFSPEGTLYAEGWNQAIKILQKAPTVDAVEVVRCKYCKWYVDDREFPPFCDNPICGMQHPNDKTFCSYGERGEDDAAD